MKETLQILLLLSLGACLNASEPHTPEITDITSMSAYSGRLSEGEVTNLAEKSKTRKIIFLEAITSAPLELDSRNVLKALREFKRIEVDPRNPPDIGNIIWEAILLGEEKSYYIRISRTHTYIRSKDGFAYGSNQSQ
ncbi:MULTISPECIES: hypothetical protein [unclassified Lentimonas]|nr:MULTISPECIES: hypothetical protein [unclassified Lentimonas]CAA6691763.1 Unannotated [Lentimonas sp. CC19]CAA6696331.1 Unannotated [Lentimonas sp. CC10]CAA7071281.1 Unannotated [Lentimonas sp. CC11]